MLGEQRWGRRLPMNRELMDGPPPLDQWLTEARRTLREVGVSDPEDDDQESTLVPVRSRNDPEQHLSQRDFLARQLTELVRRTDPDHRPITADLLPADWTTFADFDFALRMWDSKPAR